MKLTEFLKTTTQSALAEKLGVSQGLIHQWISGKTRITAERAIDVEEKTNKQITRQDLRPDLFGSVPRKQKAAA